MELAVKLSAEEKEDIANLTAQKLFAIVNDLINPKPIDRELSTAEAMELTGYRSHEYFREYIKRNRIKAVRQTKNVKYYRESDLTKAGNK